MLLSCWISSCGYFGLDEEGAGADAGALGAAGCADEGPAAEDPAGAAGAEAVASSFGLTAPDRAPISVPFGPGTVGSLNSASSKLLGISD